MKKSHFIIMLIAIYGVIPVFSQTVKLQKEKSPWEIAKCLDCDFKSIDIDIVDKDIREVLRIFAQNNDREDIKFVLDVSVKLVPISAKANDVPWHLALNAILKSQDLGVQIIQSSENPKVFIYRVAELKQLEKELKNSSQSEMKL